VKLLTDDIKTFPTEVRFVENAHDLNQIMAQGGEAEYRLMLPLDVTLTHVRSGEDLLLSGRIHSAIVGQCARCLEEYPIAVSREFSVILTPQRVFGRERELSREELEASFYSGEIIDLSALVQEQALLALPSRPLCREDCQGLCAQCGTNLNLGLCGCKPSWKDPRLVVLSTLRISSPEAAK
jgi:uncharacterized protein